MLTTSIKAADEFEPIKNEIMQLKREGRHQDVLRLQADMKQQVLFGSLSAHDKTRIIFAYCCNLPD